jgi:hypothetical protein
VGDVSIRLGRRQCFGAQGLIRINVPDDVSTTRFIKARRDRR